MLTTVQKILSNNNNNKTTAIAKNIINFFLKINPYFENKLIANLIEEKKINIAYIDPFGSKYIIYWTDHSLEMTFNTGYPIDDTDTLKFIYNHIKPGMTFIDIGANIGVYTLTAFQKNKTGKIIAIEPETSNYQRLKENLKLNNANSNILTLQNVILDFDGETELNVFSPEQYGWHSVGLPKIGNISPVSKQKVNALTLDRLSSIYGIQNIDLLKIDVEGAEINVLKGSQKLLKEKRINTILFEISQKMLEGMGNNANDVFELLANYDYSIFHLLDGNLGQRALKPEKEYENFVAIVNSK